MFLKGLLNNKIYSSVLVSLVRVKFSQRLSRSTALFYVPLFNSNNSKLNEPLGRLTSSANADPSFLNLFLDDNNRYIYICLTLS